MRTAIFDLDDTLYSREQFLQSGFVAVSEFLAQQYGMPAPWTLATLRRAHVAGRCGAEFQALCADHGVPDDLVPALVEVFRTHRPHLDLAPGAAEMLARMRADGWRLGVLTNGLPSTQRTKVDALALQTHVDQVVYAEEHAAGGKPARAAFDEALARLDADPATTVFVGDDLAKDIRGARAAGLKTIRVSAGAPRRADGEDADLVLGRLDDVPSSATSLLKGAGAHAA
jgi:putative hydrolase of the HAD superfamily